MRSVTLTTSLLASIVILSTLVACGNKGSTGGGAATQNNQTTNDKTKTNTTSDMIASGTTFTRNSYILQITALNFLTGGSESCDVKNKIFTFSKNDKNITSQICENSRVKVYAVSDSGSITFHATDVLSGAELPASEYSVRQSFQLGKDQDALRYGVQNPYGFTYVMAEEVTGIDPALLAKWNQLNDQAANLRAQILTADRDGTTVPTEVMKQLTSIEIQLQALAQKIQASKK